MPTNFVGIFLCLKLCQFTTRGTFFATLLISKKLINLSCFGMIKTKNTTMGLNIKPLADRVLIEPVEAETKTASGIIIPDNAKEKPQKGKVVAVGAGTKKNPMTVKVGETVLYGKYAGTELKLEGKDYLIMRESDVLAII